MSKLPDHLQPLYDELTVQLKDGRYTNENNSVEFKTAKEAIEHNAQMDKFVRGFDLDQLIQNLSKIELKKLNLNLHNCSWILI